MKKISIIVPVYNEQVILKKSYEKIKENIDKIENYSFEIIFINDGSSDSSWLILEQIATEDKDVKAINLSRNFGTQSAIMAGLRSSVGDAAVIIDADLQDPIEVLPDMISLWEEGNEVVYGKRKKRKGETIFKVLTAKIFYSTLNSLSDIDIPKDTGEFRLVDRKVIDEVNKLSEHNKFLRGLFTWVGFKQVPYEYVREPRKGGKTKFTLKKMFKLASDGIFSFSIKPLELIGKIGLLSVLLSFCMMVYFIILYFLNPGSLVRGWTSLIVAITFFAGVQLMSLWVIAEYIQRIYEESKNRPNYIIKDKLNMDE